MSVGQLYGYILTKYPELKQRVVKVKSNIRHHLSASDLFASAGERVSARGKACFHFFHPAIAQRALQGESMRELEKNARKPKEKKKPSVSEKAASKRVDRRRKPAAQYVHVSPASAVLMNQTSMQALLTLKAQQQQQQQQQQAGTSHHTIPQVQQPQLAPQPTAQFSFVTSPPSQADLPCAAQNLKQHPVSAR